MDFQKLRQEFEELPDIKGILHGSDFGFNESINQYYHPDHTNHRLNYAFLMGAWMVWQADKAQAVPEGFVLVKASDRDREVCELIDERDHFENQAEQLKDKLQDLYGVDFGEHSNWNSPFQNAIDFDDSDLVLVTKEMPESFDEGLYVYSNSISIVDECSEGFIPMSDINHAEVWKLVIEAQEQKG